MEILNSTIIITVVISVFVSLMALYLYSKLKKKKYNEQENKVILEDIRNSLEQKIYNLNDRMVQNEERWRDVNHLLLTKHYVDKEDSTKALFKVNYTRFLKVNGIYENGLNIDNRLVFVLTPFNDRYYQEYMTIRGICESEGFKCYRGDENRIEGDIFPYMLRHIVQARMIIANINGRNPNVLYELGVAQAMDKSVILISKEPKDLSIDIQSQRFLIYRDSDSLGSSLKTELRKLM